MTDTKKTGTTYIVLSLTDEIDTYVALGVVTANNDVQAIKAHLGDDPKPGSYIAIPSRSFKVRDVSVATETRTTVG